MKFEFSGKFKIGNEWKPFTRTIEAKTESFAKEKLLSLFGSEHGIKRRFIIIDNINKVEEQ